MYGVVGNVVSCEEISSVRVRKVSVWLWKTMFFTYELLGKEVEIEGKYMIETCFSHSSESPFVLC